MADRPSRYRAYEIHVGFGYADAPAAVEAELAPILGDRLLAVTTAGTEPARAVILVGIPHRRARPTVHHDGERLTVPEAVERAGFVHERAVPSEDYRDALEG